MKISYDPVKKTKLTLEQKNEIRQKLPDLQKSFKEKFSEYLQFLTEEEKKGHYIEIHWPFFEIGLTIMISKLQGKALVSVFNQDDSVFCGNLLVDGFACVTVDELRKFGKWNLHSEGKLMIFKPFE